MSPRHLRAWLGRSIKSAEVKVGVIWRIKVRGKLRITRGGEHFSFFEIDRMAGTV